MKIAIDCRMYNASGIGTYIKEILPYLIKTKNEFLLVGKKHDLKDFEALNNVKIQNCEIPIFSVKEIFQFPVKEINKCDIFYTPNYNIPGGIKVPIYSTIHDVIFLDIPNLTSKVGWIIRKIFYKRAYFLSKKIFTVSNFSKKRIEYHLGNKKDIIITYNGISKYILENFEINYEKKDYIIFVGNIKPHKGLKTLLLAYRKIRDSGSKTRLLIVGNKNNFKTTDQKILKIIENSKEDGVKFTGYVTNEELKKLIGEAKVLIQPSIYEGFGIPPLEALSLGTAAIISDIEVFREIYSDLPIKFFKSNDIEDLTNQILKINSEISRINVPDIFNYESCARIISENF